MQSIEQVTKRLTTDRNWFNKCMLGGCFPSFQWPILSHLGISTAFSARQTAGRDIAARMERFERTVCRWIEMLPGRIPLRVYPDRRDFGPSFHFPLGFFPVSFAASPRIFFRGPLSCSALYLYTLTGDFKSCFNFQAIGGLLKKGAQRYWVPTWDCWDWR